MPQQYDYRSGNYRITCTACDRVARTDRPYSRDAVDTDGTAVEDIFAWHSGHQRWYTRCRECDRRLRRERRANAPRVPGTTGAALGINRRFGVEIECVFPHHVSRDEVRAAFIAEGLHWAFKGDGSISGNGVEIVSRPIAGESGEQQVRTACRILRSFGVTVNRTCGTHVHHDANDLSVSQIKRVARMWFENQPLIDGLVSPSRRDSSNGYCRHIEASELRTIEDVPTLERMRSVSLGRYRTLNLTSYGRHGSLEVRQHQGTIDAEKIISWIRFGQAIIDTAKATTETRRHTTIRELFTSLGDRLDETARTFLTGRAVEFGWATV